ncbi:MAG: NAD(P)-dependent oxidoreductase, partial [Candidatus Bathyarchaeia archaeon]
VSKILKRGFDANVIGYDVVDFSKRATELGIEHTNDIGYLLSNSDIVTLHVPYSPATHHLIDHSKFALMKKGAILINTSRGDIVNGKDLLMNLREGRLKGAGLDVFHNEPPQDEWEKEVITLPGGLTVCTCHIGAQTAEAQKMAAEEVADQLVEFFKG